MAQRELAVHEAIASIDDPEYPGISIVDLGLLEQVEVTASRVVVGLIPTFSGCPALAVIAGDVERAVRRHTGAIDVVVEWLTSPVWSIDRVSADARHTLADEFGVAVQRIEPRAFTSGARDVAVEIGNVGAVAQCPRCSGETAEQSMFGPSRCRSVHRCRSCGETVEVLRS